VGALTFIRCTSLPLFQSAQHLVRRRWNLTAVTPEEFGRAKAFLSTDPDRGFGHTGFMVTEEGELVNLFNHGRPGDGRLAVGHAIAHGATHLNCYDGFLADYYALLGFVETGRAPFDPNLAPAGWDYASRGRPDVVFMELEMEIAHAE
jgi:hypothetical protein